MKTLVTMTIRDDHTDHARPAAFPATVPLAAKPARVLFSVLDKVARAAGDAGTDPVPGARVALAGVAFRRHVERGRPVAVDAVLDLAAELLEVADELLARGQDLEALALEGLAGRLTELLVGAGPDEGTPLGGRR